MTVEIIHGPPGSYKSSAAISLYAISALKAGRVLVTNVRGFVSLDEIMSIYSIDSFPDSADIINVPFDVDGFERMARWWHWAPLGSVIIMDEGQRVYPTRLKTLSSFDCSVSGRAPTVEEAFDTHRHFNFDVYITTTNIAKIHKEVRQVSDFAYRHKNFGGAFSFLKGRYKRVRHDPENNGKSLSHSLGVTSEKIDSRVFKCYQSTSTGVTKDVETSVKLFRQPKILISLLAITLSIVSFVYLLSRDGANKSAVASTLGFNDSENNQVDIPKITSSSFAVPTNSVRVRYDNSSASILDLVSRITHASAEIYSSGHRVIWFETPSGVITSDDLAFVGFSVKPTGNFYILSSSEKKYLISSKLDYDYVDTARDSVSQVSFLPLSNLDGAD